MAFLRLVKMKQIYRELVISPRPQSCPGCAAKQSWGKRADGDKTTLQPNGPAV
jgi:hypothetical protein